MGLTAENLALKYKISRKEQDEFALRSHQRAAQATDSGAFAKEVVPTWGRDEEGRRKVMHQDQGIRRDTTLEALSALKPAFMPQGGTITAGNSSQISVGAAALLVMSEDRAKELGLTPKARIRGMAGRGRFISCCGGGGADFPPRLADGEGDHTKCGGGVISETSSFTPPPRYTGSPSPSARWGGRSA